jgi:hypothetical protein
MTTPLHPSPFDLRRFAAGVGLLASLLGVGVGAHLTRPQVQDGLHAVPEPGRRLSVRRPHLRRGARVEHVDAAAAADQPVGLRVLPRDRRARASLLVRRDSFQGTAAHVLLLFAGLGVFISGSLAAYTAFVLPSPCPYCLALYAISALLLWTALAILRRPPNAPRSLREVLRERPAESCTACSSRCSCSCAAPGSSRWPTTACATASTRRPAAPRRRTRCRAPASSSARRTPPRSSPCSSTCRAAPAAASSACWPPRVSAGKFPSPVQLWIYHTPRQACDPTRSRGLPQDPRRRPATPTPAWPPAPSNAWRSCGGPGFWLIGGLFTLQDQLEPDDPAVHAGAHRRPRRRPRPRHRPRRRQEHPVPLHRHRHRRPRPHHRAPEVRRGRRFKVPTVAIYRAVGGAPTPNATRCSPTRHPARGPRLYAAQQAAAEVAP